MLLLAHEWRPEFSGEPVDEGGGCQSTHNGRKAFAGVFPVRTPLGVTLHATCCSAVTCRFSWHIRHKNEQNALFYHLKNAITINSLLICWQPLLETRTFIFSW